MEIRIPHLPVADAARIAAAMSCVYAPVPAAGHLPAEVRQLAADFPGFAAGHIVSDVPRYTHRTDPSGTVTIRHAVAITERSTRTWAAVGLRDASVVAAFAVLSAYAAHRPGLTPSGRKPARAGESSHRPGPAAPRSPPAPLTLHQDPPGAVFVLVAAPCWGMPSS